MTNTSNNPPSPGVPPPHTFTQACIINDLCRHTAKLRYANIPTRAYLPLHHCVSVSLWFVLYLWKGMTEKYRPEPGLEPRVFRLTYERSTN